MDQTEALQLRRRKRRRQRRMVAVVGFAILTIGLAWFFESQATTTIIVTRYADTLVSDGSDDPGLSPHGQVRARELARVLGDVDVIAGIDVIFVAPNRRSRDTSMPLSIKNDAPVHTVEDPANVEALVARILREHKGKIILLITEPELMQPVIAEMQGSKKLPDVAAREYDNLYIVSIPWFGKVKTLRLKFGDRYLPERPSPTA